MQRVALCSILLLAAHHAHAAGVTHIANGDCTALQNAVAAAPANGVTTNIVLARRGNYGYCPVAASANVVIDGAGAALQVATDPNVAAITVAAGASLTIRNLNLVPAPSTAPPAWGWCLGFGIEVPCPLPEAPVFDNHGTLALDTVSESGVDISFGPLLSTNGDVFLRNSSFVSNRGSSGAFQLESNSTTFEVDHTTIANAGGTTFSGAGSTVFRVSNSIVMPPSPGFLCDLWDPTAAGAHPLTSGGGNIFGDDTCHAHAQNDRVVTDAGLGDFGTHGGVVGSLALNYDSPAIGNGLAANCEAADARGAARGQTSCDSGAYEFGGGQGQIGVSGTSGLYFDHEHNGHYVTVQRVFDDNVLVIWNTFDEQGKQAWLNGVGKVNGGHIHVDQVAQNVGGTLQPGGSVNGAMPTFWGTFDLDVSSCYAATLSYNSVLPQFGNGSVNLDRLAFVNGLDCSP